MATDKYIYLMQDQSSVKSVGDKSNLSGAPKMPSSENKFFNHFQTINTPVKVHTNFTTNTGINKKLFATAFQGYVNKESIIDKIVDSPVKESRISQAQAQDLEFVTSPLMLNLNPGVREKITSINKFFQGEQEWERNRGLPANLLEYIQAVGSINTRNFGNSSPDFRSRSKSRSRSRSNKVLPNDNASTERKILSQPQATPPKQPPMKPMQEVEVNTEPVDSNREKSPQKLKRIDLLLVEIMREKKRKGLVNDYYRAIEMKLVELLEYILQDENEYIGLSLVDKMKSVLRNLESFKGKTVDGQSKVSMLRIFFEEFRNLKREREEEENAENNLQPRSHKKSVVAEKVSNAERSKAAHQNSSQFSQQAKKSQPKSHKQKSISQNQNLKTSKTFLGVPSPIKGKKNLETMSMGGKNSNPNASNNLKRSGPKSTMFEQDQWMGSLG